MSQKPSKKQSQYEYEKEMARLQKLINKAMAEDITFRVSPIPEKPEEITQDYINKLKSIKYEDIKIKGFKYVSGIGLVPYSEIETPKQASKTPQKTLKTSQEKVARERVESLPKGETLSSLSYDGLIVLDNVYSILSSSDRKTAKLLVEFIQHETRNIETEEDINYNEARILLGERMLSSPEQVIEDANIVVYASESEKELARNSAYNIAELIFGDVSAVRHLIDDAIVEDFGASEDEIKEFIHRGVI